MTFSIESGWVAATVLVSIRLGALLLLTPLLGGFAIPPRIGVMLVMALSLMIVMGAGIRPGSVPASTGGFMVLAGRELMMGAMLAFALFVAFSAFLFAGRILDMQIGFGFANLVDPITHSQAPLLGTALHLVAAVIFLAADGHHVIIRMIALSFQDQPPGAPLSLTSIELVMSHFGMIFTWGFALVAPVIFALLLLDVALAIFSRSMPQMNVFIVAIPLKVTVGLVMLAFSATVMGSVIQKILNSTFGFWQQVLGLHG